MTLVVFRRSLFIILTKIPHSVILAGRRGSSGSNSNKNHYL